MYLFFKEDITQWLRLTRREKTRDLKIYIGLWGNQVETRTVSEWSLRSNTYGELLTASMCWNKSNFEDKIMTEADVSVFSHPARWGMCNDEQNYILISCITLQIDLEIYSKISCLVQIATYCQPHAEACSDSHVTSPALPLSRFI